MIRSLRWRIATFYAILLVAVVALVAIILTVVIRTILLDGARARIDRVGAEIADIVRGDSVFSTIGEGLPVLQQLTITGALDRWSGPTTYVEIDNANGYPAGKSTNMGGATFDETSPVRTTPVLYRIETLPTIGPVLVRDEYIRYPQISLFVEVGEGLAIYDDTLARVRVLLAVVVVIAGLVVITGSFAIASSALEPIARLSTAMGEMRSDRLNRRLGWSDRRDELGSLAQSFDAMLDRLEDGFARERQFISDASHELKTPLTVINANAQMLERWADRDPAIRTDSLRAIREESASLAGMVNGMLLLAKAEAGDDIPRTPVDLRSTIADAIRATQARAAEKGLALLGPSPSDDPIIVLGDGNLLRQLFTNLIENAIKFTEVGQIDVALSRSPGEATVVVRDTGIGIEEAALERVFDRFFRTDASRDRSVPGTGLGLAIVRSIARIHGGTVVAGRVATGGAEFTVTLPTSGLTTIS